VGTDVMEEDFVPMFRVEMCMVRNWFSSIGRLHVRSLLRTVRGYKEMEPPGKGNLSLHFSFLPCDKKNIVSLK
jgi:hypothetical protein